MKHNKINCGKFYTVLLSRCFLYFDYEQTLLQLLRLIESVFIISIVCYVDRRDSVLAILILRTHTLLRTLISASVDNIGNYLFRFQKVQHIHIAFKIQKERFYYIGHYLVATFVYNLYVQNLNSFCISITTLIRMFALFKLLIDDASYIQ